MERDLRFYAKLYSKLEEGEEKTRYFHYADLLYRLVQRSDDFLQTHYFEGRPTEEENSPAGPNPDVGAILLDEQSS